MFQFLSKIFHKQEKREFDTELEIQEQWILNFTDKDSYRFVPESEDYYESNIVQNSLNLHISKKNVFAWTVNPIYRYKNFILEADIEFPRHKTQNNVTEKSKDTTNYSKAGLYAGGFLFRLISDSTFYSFLISDKGMIRFEAVVNENPLPILGWTEIPNTGPAFRETQKEGKSDIEESIFYRYNVKIIARATTFTFIINNTWVAECQDDTILAPGKIAFAGQNWNALDGADVYVRTFSMDSRPFEVEAVHSRWDSFLPIPPEARVNVARTWYAMGKYVPAIIELKKAWKTREADSNERLLAAQIYLAQRLIPEAEAEIRKAIELCKEEQDVAVIAELGGILYLENRFSELEELLANLSRDAVEGSAFLSNLEGHLWHWKQDAQKAAKAYTQAVHCAPEQGLFYIHAAQEFDLMGDKDKAFEFRIKAGNIFLTQEEYGDLQSLLEKLKIDYPEAVEVLALEGKYFFALDDFDLAEKILHKATKLGSQDSAVWYLVGLLHVQNGNDKKALKALEKATEIEPDCALYLYRLAETLFYAGFECKEAIQKAIDCDNKNAWVYNISALRALGENDLEGAEEAILKARNLLPDDLSILVNFAEIRRRQGRLFEVLPLLESADAESIHAGGRLLAEDGFFLKADEWYKKALRLTPHDAELLTDASENCIELDAVNEADDLLGRALEKERTPRMYQLAARIAQIKGDYARVEVSLLQGLEEFPNTESLLFDLGQYWIFRNKRDQVQNSIESLKAIGAKNSAKELQDIFDSEFTEVFGCDSCERTWRVPKNIEFQSSLRIHDEPPEDLPAGTCPSCGKIFCIGCAKASLGEDGRFRCLDCSTPLKLSDQRVIHLLKGFGTAR